MTSTSVNPKFRSYKNNLVNVVWANNRLLFCFELFITIRLQMVKCLTTLLTAVVTGLTF